MSGGFGGAPTCERAIVHLNVADFAVAVERGLDSRLRGRPVLVAPHTPRALVLDMSEEAYRQGVRKGMPLRRALRLCPDAAHRTPAPERYAHAMRELYGKAQDLSPLIEPGEMDGHLFLDLTGSGRLLGPPQDAAWRLRRRVRSEMGLDPIWTLAPNKLVAKAASRVIKPSGELIVAGGEEQAFMAPLPLPLVPGLDGLDLQRFRELNLATAGQAARLSLVQLEVPFGRRADFLHEVLRGVDLSPVRPPGARPPAETAAHLFDEDTNRPALLEAALFGLVERLGRRLRRQRLALRRLVVCLAYSDGLQCARAIGVRPATANDLLLFPRARAALQHAWQRRVRVRRLELRCEELVFPPAQRELFDADRRAAERRAGLVAAVDAVRERFGPQALRFGRSLAAA